MKLDIKRFDRNHNFSLWQVNMTTILVQHRVQKTLNGVDKMARGMIMTKWEEIDSKTLSAIHMSFK